jgi:hypothetical protein
MVTTAGQYDRRGRRTITRNAPQRHGTITFVVGGQAAAQTATYRDGGFVQLD